MWEWMNGAFLIISVWGSVITGAEITSSGPTNFVIHGGFWGGFWDALILVTVVMAGVLNLRIRRQAQWLGGSFLHWCVLSLGGWFHWVSGPVLGRHVVRHHDQGPTGSGVYAFMSLWVAFVVIASGIFLLHSCHAI